MPTPQMHVCQVALIKKPPSYWLYRSDKQFDGTEFAAIFNSATNGMLDTLLQEASGGGRTVAAFG